MGENLKKVLLIVLFCIFILLTVFTVSLISKARPKLNKSLAEETNIKIRVGISLGTLKEERWLKDRDILMAKLKELGADVFVQNANNDDNDQLKQAKYLLDQNIDVLILVPNDLEKAAAVVQMAQRSGVKVISYDRLVTRSNADLYISFDSEEVGRLMAKFLVEKIPRGNYLIINGAKTDHNSKLIKDGYDQVLEEKIINNDINIIAEEWATDWMSEYAFEVTDELLQRGEKIDAIICGNDSLAGGAIEALAEYRLAGKTLVVGQDADLAGCQRIVEGTQLGTVYKPIDFLAEKTAQMAIKLAKGEELLIDRTIFDGKYNVPCYLLKPMPVDKHNLDCTVLKDGFHLTQDVYRYLPKNQ